MEKNVILIVTILFVVFLVIGVSLKVLHTKDKTNVNTIDTKDSESTGEFVKEITVWIHSQRYTLTLEENATTKKLLEQLPFEVEMKELNGNEKYAYMKDEYPINPIEPKHISRGDVMLYGNNCLVLFYESFDTTYSYTKIGHIDNLEGLGKESILVKFQK